MTRVAVFGARGRMGSEVCRAVDGAGDLELVAGVDLDDDRSAAEAAEVVVDFTSPDAVMDNLNWCVSRGISAVVGTTGFSDHRLDEVRALLSGTSVGVLVAANFSIGAVLMMHFAVQAAPFYESVEIVELHHPGKVDAPSGTASSTAERVVAARQASSLPAPPDATRHEAPGARGADVSGVRVHSVRLRGLVAHQEVLFGTEGETLTVRHDSLDRASFMPGVLAGIRAVRSRPGLTVGIDAILGIV
ncbi:MAG TPA: 4-hydroxy-tetrahydrodipicolinate reductase [Propionibacteriaceae bacterium]|nr:4-hydroxy-tetrahydrodipicolinate reductase [Propionibacteriaceae bacterium]